MLLISAMIGKFFRQYLRYVICGLPVICFALCLFCLYNLLTIHHTAAVKQVDPPAFPIATVFGELGGESGVSYEPVAWNGHTGYIITGSGGKRLFCNFVGNALVVGDIISNTGENITRKMAGIFNAKTLFDTIALSTFSKANASEQPALPAIAARTPTAVDGESVIHHELFEFMEKLPSFDLAGKDGPVRLILFTWGSCPSCAAMKNVIAKKNLPFRVLEVPAGGSQKAEREAILRLNPAEADKDFTLNRIKDAALIIYSLTGKVAVPAYAWRMPDGETRFGFMSAQKVIDRLDQLARISQ